MHKTKLGGKTRRRGAKIRFVEKIRFVAKIRYLLRKFLSLFPAFLIFIPASKFSLKVQKLIQEKLQKSEKQARTKINLKIRKNLKIKIKEIKIN